MIQSNAWAWAGASCGALVLIALWLHTRVRGWLPEDVPQGSRKRHARPTPLIGFLPAGVIAVVLALAEKHGIAIGALIASLTGWLDDRRKEDDDGIRWWLKALGLAAASFAVAIDTGNCVLQVQTIFEQQAEAWVEPVLALGWTVAWMSAVIFCLANAANFLDNANGITLGLCTTGMLLVREALPPETTSSAAIAACAATWLAVLPFNWPGGRVFLGDSGALPAGLVLGAFALQSAAPVTDAAPVALRDVDAAALLAPTTVLWADFVQVVAARVVLGYRPWVADRRHLTHIAQALGLPARTLAPTFVILACAAYALIRYYAL